MSRKLDDIKKRVPVINSSQSNKIHMLLLKLG